MFLSIGLRVWSARYSRHDLQPLDSLVFHRFIRQDDADAPEEEFPGK